MFASRSSLSCAIRGTSSSFSFYSRQASSSSTYIFNWGIGTNYQLGHEKFDTEDSYLSEGVYKQKIPRRLVNSGRIKQIAYGEGYGIGVTKNKELLGWGKELPGGSASGDELKTPKMIQTPFEVEDVASGSTHCGAVDSEGCAYMWGDNGSSMAGGGQLGNSSYTPSSSPQLVKSLHEANIAISSLSCGEQHTLFLTTTGQVYSCGMAEYGRLGLLDNWNTDVLVPEQVTEAFGGEAVKQVAAGFNHSLALTEGGAVYSWGRNDQGQLGLGDTFIDMHSMEAAPRMVDSELLENKKVVKIAAGRGLSGALTSCGELYHWGHKILHQPVRVMHEYPEDKIVDFAISGQGSNMVTAFITQSGELYTVGPDSSSVLGRSLEESRAGSLFASLKGLFGGAKSEGESEEGKGSKINKVEALDGRVVHKLFGGFGQQMAAMAGPVRTND